MAGHQVHVEPEAMPKIKGLSVWQRVRITPYEMAIAVICIPYGLVALLLGRESTPSSLDDALPGPLLFVWSVLLLIGGVATIWGRMGERNLVEAIGQVSILGAVATYAVTAVALIDIRGVGRTIFTLFVYVAVLAAAWVRLRTLRKAVQATRAAARAQRSD